MPPSESTRAICEYELLPREQPPDLYIYELLVPHRDFAGEQFTTAAVSIEGRPGGTWRILSIEQRTSRRSSYVRKREIIGQIEHREHDHPCRGLPYSTINAKFAGIF
jgi:hypothetical protein